MLLGYAIEAGLRGLAVVGPSQGYDSGASLSSGAAIGGTLIAFAFMLVSLVLQVIFNHSTSVIANKQVRGQPVTMSDLFRAGSGVGSMLVFSIVYLILFCIGAVAFYVGSVLVVAFLTPGMALVADGVPLGDAIRRSFDAMKRDWLGAILFTLAWNLLILVSAIPCGLGMLATLPMVNILMALVYRDVIGMNINQSTTPRQGF